MLPTYPILAHGALGWADELIFLGVIVAFLGMMGVAWFRSRNMDYDSADLMPDNPPQQENDSSTTSSTTKEERFQLD
jgi:hypothetical protein